MKDIFSIILVAALGVLGNIVYFEYQKKKEHDKDMLKERLIKLLLPLYMICKTDELEYHKYQNNSDLDLYDYYSDLPDRILIPAKKILDENLYLADDEFQMHSLLFLEWIYSEDSNERFQKLMNSRSLKQDKVYDNFKELVYKKYDEARKDYAK